MTQPPPPPTTPILLKDGLAIYRDKVSILKKSYSTECNRITVICRHPIVQKLAHEITSIDMAQYRDDRLSFINPRTGTRIGPATVRLELALLSHFFELGRIEWGYCYDNPVSKIRKPKVPPGRDRRLTPREEKMITRHCHRYRFVEMAAIIGLALETAMRQGEILKLHWENIDLRRKVAKLYDTKNGSNRDVPLSPRAMEILMGMPPCPSGRVFSYTNSGIKSSWRGMIKKLGILDLHFHDLRHEATSRLFELGSLDLMEVAAITGHKSLAMLKRYTHLKATSLVPKLDKKQSQAKRLVVSHFIPYPATVSEEGSHVLVNLPDLDIRVQCTTRHTAIHKARHELLLIVLNSIQNGSRLPAPNQYLEDIDPEMVFMLDPLGAIGEVEIRPD